MFQVYFGLHKKEIVVQEHARVTQTFAKEVGRLILQLWHHSETQQCDSRWN